MENFSHIHSSFRKNFKYFWEKSFLCEILCMTKASFANNLILTNTSIHVNNLNYLDKYKYSVNKTK